MNFDEKMKRLDGIVARMESGKLTLDEMLAAFEEGQALTRDCQQDLASIRLRIEKVTKTRDLEEFKM